MEQAFIYHESPRGAVKLSGFLGGIGLFLGLMGGAFVYGASSKGERADFRMVTSLGLGAFFCALAIWNFAASFRRPIRMKATKTASRFFHCWAASVGQIGTAWANSRWRVPASLLRQFAAQMLILKVVSPGGLSWVRPLPTERLQSSSWPKCLQQGLGIWKPFTSAECRAVALESGR